MIHCDFEFQIEMHDPQRGRVLGRQSIEIDWVPVEEAIVLDALRQADAALGSACDVRIEPLWHERSGGRPHVGGLRASATASPAIARNFSLAFFSPYAERLSSRFVDSGELANGELYEFSVLAQPRREEAPSQRLFKVEASAPAISLTPTPIRPLMSRAILMGTDHARDLPIFVHWNVMQECAILTRRAGAMETGGVLIGRICRDEESRELFIEITQQIASPAQGELTRLTFNAETWMRVQRVIDERRTNEIWTGWWHSHSYTKYEPRANAKPPAADDADAESDRADRADRAERAERAERAVATPFLSEEDRLLLRVVFPRAYSVALLITDTPDSGMSWAAFGWRNGAIKPRGFHLIDLPLPREFQMENLTGENHATQSTTTSEFQPAAVGG
jgi:hypothetical protein